jgi:hypothetical protein
MVTWRNNLNEQADYKGYLKAFSKSSASILTVFTEINTISPDITIEEATKDIEEEDEKENIRQMYAIVQKGKDHVVYYKLYFFENGLCFEFQKSVDWLTDYRNMKEIFSDKIFEIISRTEENFIAISESEKEKIARQIIIDEAYLKTKSVVERREIAIKAASDEGVDHWYNQKLVAEKAEALYMTEIKPKLEEELKAKIKDLKDKGYTKVKIRGELGISQTTLDKLFY